MRQAQLQLLAVTFTLAVAIVCLRGAAAQPAANVPANIEFATPQEAANELFQAAHGGDLDGIAAVYAEPYASLLKATTEAGTALDFAAQNLAKELDSKHPRPDAPTATPSAYSVLLPAADAALLEPRGREGMRRLLKDSFKLRKLGKVQKQQLNPKGDHAELTLEVHVVGNPGWSPPAEEALWVSAVKQPGGWKIMPPEPGDYRPRDIKELQTARVEPVRQLAAEFEKIARGVHDGVYPNRADAVAAARGAIDQHRKALAVVPIGWPVHVPGQWEGEPAGSPFNDAATALKVVFLCDATGSMLNLMDESKDAVLKGIHLLHPYQQFDLLSFGRGEGDAGHQGGTVESAWKRPTLAPATAETKKGAREFLDKMTTGGGGDLIKAIETAFADHPDVIYLLTRGSDSRYDTEESVLKRLKELNPGARVKIHVLGLGFSGSDQPTKEEKLLQKIAAENGGLYQRVKPQP